MISIPPRIKHLILLVPGTGTNVLYESYLCQSILTALFWTHSIVVNKASAKCTGVYEWILFLAELHADLFSHRASPLEVFVFVAVAERGEDVMSDEICRRCNGKRQRRRGFYYASFSF